MAEGADQILAQGEKVVTSGPAQPNDFQEFMEGEPHQGGGVHDLEDRGMGSGIGQPQRLTEIDDDPSQQLTGQQDFAPPQGGEAAEEQDWQGMYGREANEKGKWRRTAEDALNRLEQLKDELGMMQTAFQQPSQAYPVAPPAPQGYAPQQGHAPQQPQMQPQFPATYFPNKGEGDFLEPGDVDEVIRTVDATMQNLHQQGQALYAQQLQLMKMQAGLTPQIEHRLATQHPWIAQMPEGPGKVQAMQQLARAEDSGQQQARRPRPAQAQVSPQQAAARRVTYIENNRQRTPAESEVPVQQRMAQEWAQAKTSAEKRALLEKYGGIKRVNDWGPGVLTR